MNGNWDEMAVWDIAPLTWYKGKVDTMRPDGCWCIPYDVVVNGTHVQHAIMVNGVDKPLEAFRKLAAAGSKYELRALTSINGGRICASGDNDDELIWFCERHGLPTDLQHGDRPMPEVEGWPLYPYNSMAPPVYPLWDGSSRATVGYADAGIRTTAALAHLCQTLIDLKNKWASIEQMAVLYKDADASGCGVPLYTFIPNCQDMNMPRALLFPIPEEYAEKRERLRWAVRATIIEIVTWYLHNTFRIEVQKKSDNLQLVQAVSGLRGYLWLKFALSIGLTMEHNGVWRQCIKHVDNFGTTHTFWTTHQRQTVCDECTRIRKRENKRAERASMNAGIQKEKPLG